MVRRAVSIVLAGLLLFCGIGPVSADTDAAEKSEATVLVDTDSVMVDEYLGVGFEWDPSDSYEFTDEQWDMIFKRVEYTKAPVIRLMLRANTYTKGFDRRGNPVYDWNTPGMKRIYKILDYCQKNNIWVIIGEWSRTSEPPVNITASDDPRWARLIGDFMDYMLNTKKYDCIKYYNFINEPNGYWATEEGDRFAIWKRGMQNLYKVFKDKRLLGRIQLLGPDSTGADEWVDWTVHAIPELIGGYDIHRYSTDNFVLNGEVEKLVRSKRDVINKNDPRGADKPFIMGEAGIVEGKIEEHDQQPRVKDFDYGALMADYTIQTIRGGQAGLISWMLDDAMHDAPGYEPGTGHLKIWGFWNTIGDARDQALRPWYYPMSLFSRYFPRGSKTVFAGDTGTEKLRTAAAVIPAGGKRHLTIAIVNNSDIPRTARIIVPNVQDTTDVNKFEYYASKRPADENGFPVPSERLQRVNLREGVQVTLPERGFVLLTTMDTGGGGISLAKGGNLALGQDVHASSTEYAELHLAEDIVDGKPHTSWKSKRTDPQWIAVDLGSRKTMNRVKIHWDEGYAKSYKIQVSDNGIDWREAYSSVLGEGGTEDMVFAPVTARHVRLFAAQAGTPYGISVKEMGVYHIPNAPITDPPKAPMEVADPLDNWNLTYSHSGDLVLDDSNIQYFNGDKSRVKRYDTGTKSIVYHLEKIVHFSAKIYFSETMHEIKFYVSADGSGWEEVQAVHDSPVPTSDGWHVTRYTSSVPVPGDARFLKIEVSGGDGGQPWSPQIGEVYINTPMPNN